MKTKLIYIVVLFLSILVMHRALGEGAPPLRLATPPSPDAASLGKYGQYPVSLYNGLVKIDIPIYTIELPLYNLPVSISYHASGIKINEISSTVGLGWALNAGGVITRSVRGMPDEKFGSTKMIHGKQWVIDNFKWANNPEKNNYLFYRYIREITGDYDSESDIYYYNVCGLTGSFRFNKDGHLIQIPLSNNKIELLSGDRFQSQITLNNNNRSSMYSRKIHY
jgi:hypothetical protein